MFAGRRYSLFSTLRWSRKSIFIFIVLDAVVVSLYHIFELDWMRIPWQPISLIGIAVAFYLGFKNNSSYERLWEARKIWGGIVNVSRSFTVMAKHYINNDETTEKLGEKDLAELRTSTVKRHIAWLYAMTIELRKVKSWEHNDAASNWMREALNSGYKEENFLQLKDYLSEEDFDYVMSKGNKSSHLLSSQTSHLMKLRQSGAIEHFRHLAMQDLITEMYTLQGKSERIKNFPFPRQYATVNYFFTVLFIILLPFGMLDVFISLKGDFWIWMTIPFSVVGSWVFWVMEMIGDYSENPFEGLYNDVPISSMARGIEIDILQMLDVEKTPEPQGPEVIGGMDLLI